MLISQGQSVQLSIRYRKKGKQLSSLIWCRFITRTPIVRLYRYVMLRSTYKTKALHWDLKPIVLLALVNINYSQLCFNFWQNTIATLPSPRPPLSKDNKNINYIQSDVSKKKYSSLMYKYFVQILVTKLTKSMLSYV